MHDLPPNVLELAKKALDALPELQPGAHALIILGIGSGAFVDLVLQMYGPPRESETQTWFLDNDTRPMPRLPIWVVENDTDAVARAVERFEWSETLAVRQLRFFTGPDALEQVEKAIADPMSAQPTTWMMSPDANWTRKQQDSAVACLSKAVDRLVRSRDRLPQVWRDLQSQRAAAASDPARRVSRSERFRDGNRLRVLCIGTRFATFVGHSMVSLARGFERLGHQVVLLQEPSDSHRIKIDTIQSAVNDLDPDLVVNINYTRTFYNRQGCCLDGFPYCCWMQDPQATNDLYRDDTRAQHTEHDFYFSCMQVMKDEMDSLGYGPAPIVKAPTDDELYTPGDPDAEDRARFGSDVSCISTIDPSTIRLVNSGVPEGATDPEPYMHLDAYQENVRRLTAGETQLLPEDYRRIILARLGVGVPPPELEKAVVDMTLRLEATSGRLPFRSLPLIWLSKEGYDIDLYGQGWDEHPILAAHHRGTIPYGRAQVRMLRVSTIYLCTHGIWTMTMKVLDCLAAGAFPLVHCVDPRRDTEPITTWYREDQDIVLFRTREELLDKTRYYLAHPEERRRIAARGREITLQRFTYLRAAESMLATIRDRLRS